MLGGPCSSVWSSGVSFAFMYGGPRASGGLVLAAGAIEPPRGAPHAAGARFGGLHHPRAPVGSGRSRHSSWAALCGSHGAHNQPEGRSGTCGAAALLTTKRWRTSHHTQPSHPEGRLDLQGCPWGRGVGGVGLDQRDLR